MNQVALENFKIDKSNSKKVKLGDVVYEPKETVKDPVKEGIQHVVGLEHIDSENIHLRRSASIDESTTFTKKFRKGDVLFGRRRAYLKKAAFANFDGICSGDITVMRAKDGLLPELLPFIINNDKFFDYAITHSAGGLSPRVKFKDLANFEFTYPPIETQPRLIDLMLVLDEYLIQSEEVYAKTSRLKNILVKNLVSDASEFSELGSLFDVSWGNTNITKKSYISTGFDAYSATGLDGLLPTFLHATEGIVLSAIGADCGKCFYATGKWTAIKNTITIMPRFDNLNYLKLIYEIVNDREFWPTSGGAQPFISQSDARKVLIPKMSDDEISKSNLEIEYLKRSLILIENKNNHIKKLFKYFTNQLF